MFLSGSHRTKAFLTLSLSLSHISDPNQKNRASGMMLEEARMLSDFINRQVFCSFKKNHAPVHLRVALGIH